MLTAKAGFRIFVVLFLSHYAPMYGQQEDPLGAYKWKAVPNQSTTDRLVFYYFGASDCAPCIQAENVKAIRGAKEQAARKHPEFVTVSVGVSFDTDYNAGLAFLKKYGEWDEISIGGGFYNQLWLQSAPPSSMAAIPHVLIFLDRDGYSQQRYHYTAKRTLVGEYMDFIALQEWIARGCPLWLLEVQGCGQEIVDVNTGKSPFLGHWRSRKADQSFGIVETELNIQQADSGGLSAFVKSEGSAETQCPEVKFLTPQRLKVQWTTNRSDHGTECVVSVDEKSLLMTINLRRSVFFRREKPNEKVAAQQ
jgi:hypothetical protein